MTALRLLALLNAAPVDVTRPIGSWMAMACTLTFASGFTPLLAVLAAIVAVVLVRVAQRAKDPVMVVALSLVLGGALGNLIDRLFRAPGFLRGEVVDFVRVGAFPTFNVADSAITVGVAVLLLGTLWRSRRSRRT